MSSVIRAPAFPSKAVMWTNKGFLVPNSHLIVGGREKGFVFWGSKTRLGSIFQDLYHEGEERIGGSLSRVQNFRIADLCVVI